MNLSIKWVKNSRVKKNPKIAQEDIVEKESDAMVSDVVVAMTDITKKYPIINIHFPQNPKRRENKIQNHTTGDWITKSWMEYQNSIVTINTEEDCIHFNRTEFSKDELKNCLEVINKVMETV
jgi:hypothetical protein